MKEQKRANFLRYLIGFSLAISVAVGILFIKGVNGKTAKELLQTLHDAFFATGAFCLLYAGLLFVDGKGAFLGIDYAFRRAIQALLPFSNKTPQKYAQDRAQKQSIKKNASADISLRIGAFFLFVSLVFLLIWLKT